MGNYDYKITAAGRVNLIGEHIDYCGGRVFPVALSQNNAVYVRPNGTDKINIRWTTLSDEVSLDIANLSNYRNLKYGNYQAGAAYIWQQSGHKIVGCDMLHDCTVPFGAGLSSSAAIEVSTIAALATVAGEGVDPLEIALLAQRAEREYVGMNCGIMDQFAAACGRAGHAMLLDCGTLECEYVPLQLGEYTLVITNTNKPHNLVESKYNERRAECEEALEILQKHINISCLAALDAQELSTCSHLLPERLLKRVQHVACESARVRNAVCALKKKQLNVFGYFLNQSHNSLRYLYEVTGKELDALVEAARRVDGCIGSRMTGGGFGGSTVSLVKTAQLSQFKKKVEKDYRAATGLTPTFYETSTGDGLTVEKLS